jgi:antitoxin ParD1/3/4
MATKELSLPSDIAAELEARVAHGEAATVADVLRAALAALEAEESRKLDALREKIAKSFADPRPSVAADEVFDRVDRMLDSLKR